MTQFEPGALLAVRRMPSPGGGCGANPRSSYVEHFWTPLVGPTATSLARALIRSLRHDDGGVEVAIDELIGELGLIGDDAGADLEAALVRLTDAGIVARTDDGTVLIGTELPHLSADQVDCLPEPLQVAHRSVSELLAGGPEAALPPTFTANARMLSILTTVDEILTNAELSPRQLAYRWQHVTRVAEDCRDEAVLEWAAPDLESTLAEGQQSALAMSEAVWASQHAVASRGMLPETCRSHLFEAAAGLVDWLVDEFPPPSESWARDRPQP